MIREGRIPVRPIGLGWLFELRCLASEHDTHTVPAAPIEGYAGVYCLRCGAHWNAATDSDHPSSSPLRPMSEAPRDGTQILAVFHKDLVARSGERRDEQYEGRAAVIWQPGTTPGMGWNWAPGIGGFDDEFFVGWMPLPPAIAKGALERDAEVRDFVAKREAARVE